MSPWQGAMELAESQMLIIILHQLVRSVVPVAGKSWLSCSDGALGFGALPSQPPTMRRNAGLSRDKCRRKNPRKNDVIHL